MKVGSKGYLKLRIKLQQLGIVLFIFGLILWINELGVWKSLMTSGLFIFSVSKFMQAAEPVYDDPQWERVFPELDPNYDFEDIDLNDINK